MKIKLFSDRYAVSDELHDSLKNELMQLGFDVDESRADTSACGGAGETEVIWWAQGWIIFLSTLSATAIAAFLAESVLAKFTKILGNIKLSEPHYIGAPCNGVDLYFSFDPDDCPIDPTTVKSAIQMAPVAERELKELLTEDFLQKYNSPKKIILRYNFKLDKWVINHFDINTPIYYDETHSKYSTKPIFKKLTEKTFGKVLKDF